jgi:hypothetical protein
MGAIATQGPGGQTQSCNKDLLEGGTTLLVLVALGGWRRECHRVGPRPQRAICYLTAAQEGLSKSGLCPLGGGTAGAGVPLMGHGGQWQELKKGSALTEQRAWEGADPLWSSCLLWAPAIGRT